MILVNGEFDIILKLRNLEIRENLSFCQLLNKICFKATIKVRFFNILYSDLKKFDFLLISIGATKNINCLIGIINSENSVIFQAQVLNSI